LTNEDIQSRLGEWSSMVAALRVEIAADDEQLNEHDHSASSAAFRRVPKRSLPWISMPVLPHRPSKRDWPS